MSKFKGGNGRWLTKALFLELSYEDTSRVLYTLKEHDHEMEDGTKLPSLKRLYLGMDDPNEYNFAETYLGGWQHWKELTTYTLSHVIGEWREELELKLESMAFQQLKELAESGDRMAAQFIAKKEYKPKRKAGAPSKAEVAGELKRQSAAVTSINSHWERINK